MPAIAACALSTSVKPLKRMTSITAAMSVLTVMPMAKAAVTPGVGAGKLTPPALLAAVWAGWFACLTEPVKIVLAY